MRMTHTTALVLLALSRGSHHGFDIVDATGLHSGTVYPILRRMEREGLVRSKWEAVKATRESGRPPRRNYAMTRAGDAAVREALHRYPNLSALLEGVEGRPASST
jgi:PadR family transcriptional regulator